ncbi:MAG: tetratricopeptide repeat protein [Pseudomonadota bacterium]
MDDSRLEAHDLGFQDYSRAETLIDLGRYDQALTQIAQQLTRDPEDPTGHFLVGVVHLHKSQYDEAISACHRSLGSEPGFAPAYHLLSFAWHGKYHFDNELKCAEEAVRLEPDDPQYLHRLAEAQQQSGQIAKALVSAREATRLDPESAHGHALLAELALEYKQKADAEKHYRAALELEPENEAYLHNLARVLTARGKHLQAIELMFDAARVDPSNALIRDNLYSTVHDWLGRNIVRFRYAKAKTELPPALVTFYEQERSKAGFFKRHYAITFVGLSLGALVLITGMFSTLI